VRRPDDCARLVRTAVEQYGRLDCVVANAGISMWARFDETEDLALFRKLVDVNYLGAVHRIHPVPCTLWRLTVAITDQAPTGVLSQRSAASKTRSRFLRHPADGAARAASTC
jgi:NAD(P)-dependent dehydrogenase (short-subunit alcohol dehydrogenase family)